MDSLAQKVIKHKLGLLNMAAELGNVSRASKVMGVWRVSFYCCQSARAVGGFEALLDADRKKPKLRNLVEPAIEEAGEAYDVFLSTDVYFRWK